MFKFSEQEKTFFSSTQRFIYFILCTILFYSIAINTHGHLAKSSIAFAAYLIICLAIVMILKQLKQAKLMFVYIGYMVTYCIVTLLFGFFKFDPVFMLIITMYLYLAIKIHKYVVFGLESKETIQILNYSIADDFNHKYAYQKYDMPFLKNEDKKRSLQEELFILNEYNKLIQYKNKIKEKNIQNFTEINFMLPKSLLVSIYQVIIEYQNDSLSAVETKPIEIKIFDKTETLEANMGQYLVEFKFDRQNLISIRKNNKSTNIKHGIEEIYNIVKENKMDVKIRHGMNKGYYIIRVHFNINQISNEFIEVVQKMHHDKVEPIREIDIKGTEQGRTEYDKTQYATLDKD